MPKLDKDWPPQQLIDDLLKRCQAAEDKGTTRFAGMSYEQGILYGIRWMCGTDENLM
jgi:hypothetical protein